MGKLNSLTQLMYFIYYSLLFFKNDNLKYKGHLKEDLSILSRYFTFFYLIVFFFIISFQTFIHKETSRLYSILQPHTLSFLYNVLNSVRICCGRRVFEEYFYCYFQQFISAVANESQFSITL